MQYAGILSELGNLYVEDGAHEKAEEFYREALTLLQRRFDEYPLLLSKHVATNYYSIGTSLFIQHRYEAAAANYLRAFDILEEAAPDLPESTRLAWFRATCPDPKFRDLDQSLALADRIGVPTKHDQWLALGVARYRAGQCAFGRFAAF